MLKSPVLSSPVPKCRFTYLSLTPAGAILGGTWRVRALSQAVERGLFKQVWLTPRYATETRKLCEEKVAGARPAKHTPCAATQTNILKNWENRHAESVQISEILQNSETFCKTSHFSDKEEVPGSSPGRPTLRFPFVFRESASEAVSAARCPFAFATYVQLIESAYGEKGAWGPRRKGRYVGGSNHCPLHLRDP